MTGGRGKALETPLAYHHPWAGRDFERAMTYIADDIVCDAPAGRVEGAQAYRAFMGPFVQMLRRTELIAAFGDDETALLMYDTETELVPSAPGAECVTVEGGKIVRSRFLFDRAPFQEARRAPG